MKINITALLKSKPEHIQETKTILTDLASTSKKEKACIQYDLHQAHENQDLFILHEVWESQEGLALHETQDHFVQFIAKAPELLAEPIVIYKTNRIV